MERLIERLEALGGGRRDASAADEEVVEGPPDLHAIAAPEDLCAALQKDLRVAMADLCET